MSREITIVVPDEAVEWAEAKGIPLSAVIAEYLSIIFHRDAKGKVKCGNLLFEESARYASSS